MDEATLFRGYHRQALVRRVERKKALDARVANGHVVAPVTTRPTIKITKQCARCVLATVPGLQESDLCQFCRRDK